MVNIKVKNYDGKMYLKEVLQNILDTNPVIAIPNQKAVLMFPENCDLDAVRRSCKLILKDIENRLQNPE